MRAGTLKGIYWCGAAIVASVVASGCGEDLAADNPVMPSTAPGAINYKPNAEAGVPVDAPKDAGQLNTLVASRSFSGRSDPFALFGSERQFENLQRGERLLGDVGGFTTEFTPPVEVVEEEQIEPQPYRRLAGVLVGDTVLALIIMEDGTTHVVRPGMMIPNSEWRVVSIDGDRAILRRAGNRRPNQIEVRLESPPPGAAQGGGGSTGGGTGPATSGGGRRGAPGIGI